ncbi:glycoside hydrolase family 32 protein [Chondrinema litorale]|uniref:glycoside hydrolase family 32 protein n=1 Tax=Chondrinema litorale TaxID=2994555 RepID=UPI0025430300|nr:glycoside hydrolase family 32 protein [Chondrinema litorale]UZR96552.1 glycoside hydrolase family 32 protein [Chondrinema litorale]
MKIENYLNLLTIIIITLMWSCNSQIGNKEISNQNQAKTISYQQKYRPQYHYSPPENWMNDPNGMFYFDGEYHLFYQHYPDSNVWGPMHWGHAISKDMVNWENLPIALYPDEHGMIFSGSAVVDKNNTSGFGTEENPPLVAIFTYHDMEKEKAGEIKYQTQGIAYSTDKGRTWTKYENNPVLENPGIKDFRDPKVSWYEADQKWIMTLAVKDHISFYSSPNLKDWTLESDFGKTIGAHGGVWECPDLFPMVDSEGNKKWVILLSINPGGPQGGSATQYFVGDFNGKKFTPYDTEIRWIDYGADNYAGVTWSDIPKEDGRRLFLGWMSNWQYANIVPTYDWRSAMTIPRTFHLTATNKLLQKPVKELNNIMQSPQLIDDFSISSEKTLVENLELAETAHFIFNTDMGASNKLEMSIENDSESFKLIVDLESGIIATDRSKSGLTDFHLDFTNLHEKKIDEDFNLNSLEVFVDAASFEIFINDGELVFTEIVFPENPYNRVAFTANNNVQIQNFAYHTISSIWQKVE